MSVDAGCLPLEHKQLLKNAQLELKKSKRKDYYKILGVDKNASEDEIKKAYRKRALMHHPGRAAPAIRLPRAARGRAGLLAEQVLLSTAASTLGKYQTQCGLSIKRRVFEALSSSVLLPLDRHSGASAEVQKEEEKKFKEVGEAFTILSDPKKKTRYDSGQDLDEEGMNMGGESGAAWGSPG